MPVPAVKRPELVDTTVIPDPWDPKSGDVYEAPSFRVIVVRIDGAFHEADREVFAIATSPERLYEHHRGSTNDFRNLLALLAVRPVGRVQHTRPKCAHRFSGAIAPGLDRCALCNMTRAAADDAMLGAS